MLENNEVWRHYKCWSLIRITGLWPGPLFGNVLMHYITKCPLCGSEEVPVRHALVNCEGTSRLFGEFFPLELQQRAKDPGRALRHLFVVPEKTDQLIQSIVYVGRAVNMILKRDHRVHDVELP